MTRKKRILGSRVRCTLSGFEGTAVVRSEFVNGCVQYTVLGKAIDNKPPEDISVDEQNLEVIKKPKIKKATKKAKTSRTGGPNRPGVGMRGY